MIDHSRLTPRRRYLTGCNAKALEESIIDSAHKKTLQQCIVWGTLNFCLLSILLYDVLYTHPMYVTYVQYVEYVGAIILFLNIIYHAVIYIKIQIYLKKTACKCSNLTCLTSTPVKCYAPHFSDINTPINVPPTPVNLSSTSWLSNLSSPESKNLTFDSVETADSWTFCRGSPKSHTTSSTKLRLSTSEIDIIKDEKSLSTYLKDFEAYEKVINLSKTEQTGRSIFWTHPTVKVSKNISSYLKRCYYQLSTPTAGSASNSPKSDDNKGSPHGSPLQGMDMWRRLHVDTLVLTQWNANLRIWLSQTILRRLVKEFGSIDEALQKHGFGDVQIGKVGLERLRKTAQTIPVLQFIQTLPIMIPFLELTSNQEYLVKRINELAKGGCMSDFKWNSGGSFNGKEWDTNLPTDSAIIMHLFASYLDTQLQPLPNNPDVKPFSGYHFIKQNENPVLNANTLAIQQCSEYPPYYKVVVGHEIFELVKGYNNLFHSILLFLYYVNEKEHGMLGQVNLGRSGVNLLWVIQS